MGVYKFDGVNPPGSNSSTKPSNTYFKPLPKPKPSPQALHSRFYSTKLNDVVKDLDDRDEYKKYKTKITTAKGDISTTKGSFSSAQTQFLGGGYCSGSQSFIADGKSIDDIVTKLGECETSLDGVLTYVTTKISDLQTSAQTKYDSYISSWSRCLSNNEIYSETNLHLFDSSAKNRLNEGTE